MATRDLGVTIDVRRDLVMYHTVLCVGHDREPVAVAITTNPTDHKHYAQVVMHKTRSHGCATQVARYVRRRFEIEEPVMTHRAPRPVEAMIGYACAGGMQHAPTDRTPGWGVFQHIAATPIAELLREVAGGHNAARTRYVVYEVRSGSHSPHRGITHRYNALERRYQEAPPDQLVQPEVVQVGRYATMDEARDQTMGHMAATDFLWTRKPDPEYVRRILAVTLDRNEIVWRCDREPAVRRYDFPAVCIGPHVYTEFQIRHVLEHGAWPPDGRSSEGRRLIYGGPSGT
jgi:hypothetical protein